MARRSFRWIGGWGLALGAWVTLLAPAGAQAPASIAKPTA
jgi:hypothetical protein